MGWANLARAFVGVCIVGRSGPSNPSSNHSCAGGEIDTDGHERRGGEV